MTPEHIDVQHATDDDLTYIVALQRKNRESVGGLPSQAFQERIERNGLLIARINNDPVGYLMYDRRGPLIRIPQACIQYDARRRHHGYALVQRMFEQHPDVSEVRLRCAADIDANIFWKSLGFQCVNTEPGGTRRKRLINIWQLWLDRRLITLDDISTAPAFQLRIDCQDQQTGFMKQAPDGFVNAGTLDKIAWSNRKQNQ